MQNADKASFVWHANTTLSSEGLFLDVQPKTYGLLFLCLLLRGTQTYCCRYCAEAARAVHISDCVLVLQFGNE